MKLLICTQKVDKNDPVLGFFHRWILEFAKHCEEVHVICLSNGEHALPQNVHVYSLGKEEDVSRMGRIVRFYRYIFRLRKKYDTVFVHMNPEYVVLGGVFWKLWHKKISLWYTHKAVGIYLRIAEKFSDLIFTASKESFRLKSKKVHTTGHGIDTDFFAGNEKKANDTFTLLTVGRISPVKDYETLFRSVASLIAEGENASLVVVGGPGTPEQVMYEKKLRTFAKEPPLSGHVYFAGPLPQEKVVTYLREADLFVNMSHTGSLDKAVLEAMAMRVPVVSCNEAVRGILAQVSADLVFLPRDVNDLAAKIKRAIHLDASQKERLGNTLRTIVMEQHELGVLVGNIVRLLETFHVRN